MATKDELMAIIRDESKKANIDPAIMYSFAKQEVGAGLNIRNNPNSSAKGLFQFIDSTRKAYGNFDPNDPVASTKAAIQLTKDNAKVLGIPVTVENAGKLYLAHQQGATTAKKLLNADPNSPITTFMKAKTARINGMGGMTVGQGLAKYVDTTNKSASAYAGGQAVSDDTAIRAFTGNNNTSSLTAQSISAAQQQADLQKSVLGTFGQDNQDPASTVSKLGTSSISNADALTALYARNAALVSKKNPDGTAKSTWQNARDRLIGVTGNALEEEYLKAVEAQQAETSDRLTKQATNLQGILAPTTISPAVYQNAAKIGIDQQGTDQQGVYQQGQLANQKENIAVQQSQVNLAEKELAYKNAVLENKVNGNGVIPTGEGLTSTDNLVAAAKLAGIELPAGVKVSELPKYVPKDKLDLVKGIAAQGGTLGNDPYTSVQTVKALGSAATPELLQQAQIHDNFQQAALRNAGYKEVPVALGTSKEQAAAMQATQDGAKRLIISKAYADAANGVGGLALTPGNPYSSLGGGKEVYNGVPIPKGVTVEEMGKLPVVDFIMTSFAAGNTSVDIANTYKALAANASKGVNFSAFSAPSPSGKFLVQIKGIDTKIDLATPAGVEQFKALANSSQAVRRTNSAFGKMASAANDLIDPRFYVGTVAKMLGINNPVQDSRNAVDQYFGTPQVTLNPK